MITLQQHAEKVLRIQDACNAHGVVVAMESWMSDFGTFFPSYSTSDKNEHPITVLYIDKLASLANCQALGHDTVMEAYNAVYEIEKTGLGDPTKTLMHILMKDEKEEATT